MNAEQKNFTDSIVQRVGQEITDAAQRGFYGEITLTVKIEDGTIQTADMQTIQKKRFIRPPKKGVKPGEN